MKADTQTSLRLPAALRDRLTKAAEANGHSAGEEIRQRLEGSFGRAAPHRDEETRELLIAIEDMADTLAEYYPAWHADPFSLKAFATAVFKYLAGYGLKFAGEDGGEPEPKPLPNSPVGGLLKGTATVDNVSAMLVRGALSTLSALAEFERR